MRAVCKDYFLDHDHSAYVDQCDWEKVITEKERTLDYLKDTVKKISMLSLAQNTFYKTSSQN